MILKVLDKRKETKDIFSLILEKPEGFRFYPGQYLDIELPVDDPLGKTRIFSLSSSPGEDFLMLTFKLGVSKFKKKLISLKKGAVISSSHPAGTVVMDDSSPLVMLAGGIGIAPHRSMIKWAVDQKSDLPITLVYSNSTPDFVFKNELDAWQKQYPKLKSHYVVTTQDGRLNFEKLKNLLYPLPLPAGRHGFTLYPIYYLAGPPKMVDEFETALINLGVDEINIRTDRFDGY